MKKLVAFVAIFLLLNDGNSKVLHRSQCSHSLTNQKGSFSTPKLLSEPSFYPDNSRCRWNITVPRDGNVTITFTNFHTEACCDYVTITNENGKLYGQYSGAKPDFNVTITHHQARRVDIVFKSDASVYKAGFKAHYVIHGQVTRGAVIKPTALPPATKKPSGGGYSLMEAFLKMTGALTIIINSLIDSAVPINSGQMENFKGDVYQGLQMLETLKRVKTSALSKDENDQINVALKFLNMRSKTAKQKLKPKLSRAACKLDKKPGPCRAAFKRFFYDGRRCKSFIYGGCQGNANNFLKKQSCKELCETSICPPGVPVFNCFVDPCNHPSCSAYMTIGRCEANYCGGCNAVYYDQHGLVIPNNRCNCPVNETAVKCAVDPCKNATCKSHPLARCRSRRCANCTAEFVLPNSTVVEKC